MIENTQELRAAYLKLGSLRAVARLTGHSPNTIKKYVSFARSNNIIKNTKSDDPCVMGLYVGLWMGDGTQYYDKGYTVKICCNNDDANLNLFIQRLIFELFGKKTVLIEGRKSKSAVIKFSSKFIFRFIDRYACYDSSDKTFTVGLKKDVEHYPRAFLRGCFLGLMLSDGCLKTKLAFNTISARLAHNMCCILKSEGFSPRVFVHDRKRWNWRDLHCVYLRRKESEESETLLDSILRSLGSPLSFKELKRY